MYALTLTGSGRPAIGYAQQFNSGLSFHITVGFSSLINKILSTNFSCKRNTTEEKEREKENKRNIEWDSSHTCQLFEFRPLQLIIIRDFPVDVRLPD